MLNFFISIIVFASSAFFMAMSIRHGMIGTERLDQWLTSKSGHHFDGFDWYYRIPFGFGTVPEYFYAMVLGKDNYFKTNWWALKTSSFLSVLLFIALLKSRTGVAGYYSLTFLGDKGIMAFFTSGTFIWYMNIITLSYLGLLILITVESIKVAGIYAPIRVIFFGILSLFMSTLTIAVLFVIIFVSVVYLGYKIISFLFFRNKHKIQQYNDEETAGKILNKGLSGFKPDLYAWEAERKAQRASKKVQQKPKRKPVITRKKRIVKQKPEVVIHNENIPRLHPD